MAFSEQTVSFEKRLGQQLHSLGELSEALTLKLLEIEARVKNIEERNISIESNNRFIASEFFQEIEKRVDYLQGLLDVGGVGENHLNERNKVSCEINCHEKEDSMRLLEEGQNSHDGNDRVETQYFDDPQMPMSA